MRAVYLGVIAIFVVIFYFESESAPEIPECENRMQAFKLSKQFVEMRLRSPSTAKFSSLYDTTITYLGDCTHDVRGYVDAQNGFGAMIRTSYRARMRYNGVWNLESLEM